MDEREQLIRDLYKKYGGRDITPENVQKVISLYGDDNDSMIRDIYKKFKNSDLDDTGLGKIKSLYFTQTPGPINGQFILEQPLPSTQEPLNQPRQGFLGTLQGAVGEMTRAAQQPATVQPETPIANAIGRGEALAEEAKILKPLSSGRPQDEDIARLAELQKKTQSLPASKVYQEFSGAKTFGDAIKTFTKNPVPILAELTAESMSSLAARGIEVVPKRVMQGTVMGGALGSTALGAGAVPGAMTGAGAGAITGMAQSSLELEFAGKIMDSFAEAGVDITDPESLKKAFEDDKVYEAARNAAYAKSIPIFLFDLVSGGVAGKIITKPAKSLAGKIIKGAGEFAIQGTFGGGGELASQIVAGEDIQPGAILGEVLGEAAMTPVEVAVGVGTLNKAEIGEIVSTGNPALDEAQNQALDLSKPDSEVIPNLGTIQNAEVQEPSTPATSSNEIDSKTALTQGFFSSVVKGEKGTPRAPWSPIVPLTKDEENFNQIYSQHKGTFDEHIATSIPSFRETQIKKGTAILNTLPKGGLLYDIAGSEGGFAKTITQLSDGKIKSVNLDVNEDMAAAHNRTPVEGAEFVNEAFFQPYTDEGSGKVYPKHKPAKKADIVHESMGFQFISPERTQFVDEIKDNYLKSDGLLILEEKVVPESEDEFLANEAKKDTEYKSRFYTVDDLNAKREEVLSGMRKNQTKDTYLQDVLKERFDYVYQYWDSGNFKGYVASNNKAKIEAFAKNIGDTKTEFSTREQGFLKQGLFSETPEFQQADQKIAELADQIRVDRSNPTLITQLNEAIQQRDNARIAFEQKRRSQSPIKAGFQKAKQVTMEEMSLLKKQIKDFAKGVRTGRLDEKKARVEFVGKVRELIGKQQLPLKKQIAILNRVGKTNLLNPVQVARSLAYVSKATQDAEYLDKVFAARSLTKKIKGKIKKFTPAQKAVVKELTSINPSNATNIDEHLNMLSEVFANTQSPEGEKYLPFNEAQVSAYNAAEQTRAAAVDQSYLDEEFAENGLTPEEVTTAEQEGVAEDETKKKLVSMASDRQKSLKDVEADLPLHKEILAQFKSANLEDLTPDALIGYIRGVDNIVLNSDYGGLMNVAASLFAAEQAPKIAAMENATGSVNWLYSIDTDQWAEVLKNLGKSSQWAAELGAYANTNNVYGKNAQVSQKSDEFAQGVADLAKESSKKGVDVLSSDNVILTGLFAELVQSKETETVEEGFARSKQNIETDLETKATVDPENYELQKKQWEKLSKANSVEEAFDIMKKNYPEQFKLWEYFKNSFEKIYPDHAANTEALRGRVLPKFRNYTPLSTSYTPTAKVAAMSEEQERSADTDQLLSGKYVVTPSASRTTQARKDNLVKGVHMRNRSFVDTMLNKYEEAMYDIMVAPEVAKTAQVMKRPEMVKTIGNDNFDPLVRLFNSNVKLQRGGTPRQTFLNSALSTTLNGIQKIAYLRALGGVTTGIGQATSSLWNSIVQLGSDAPMLFKSYPNSGKVRSQYTIGTRAKRMGGLKMDEVVDAKARNEFKRGIKAFVGKYAESLEEKVLSVAMASFTYGDVKPAEQAWNAYYLQALRDRGVDTSKADTKEFWDNEAKSQSTPERRYAAAYAEQKVDENLLGSQQEKGARVTRTKGNLAAQLIKASMFPFISYTLGLKKRIFNRARTLASTKDSAKNKGEAVRDLTALFAEVYIFALVSKAVIAPISELTKSGVRSLFDIPEPEEDEEDKEAFADKLFTLNLINNLLPWTVNEMTTEMSNDLLNYINYLLFSEDEQTQKDFEDQNDGPALISFSKNKEWWEKLGMISITAGIIDNIDDGFDIWMKESADEPTVITITDSYGNVTEKELSEEEAQLVKFNAIVNMLAVIGVQLREITNAFKSVNKDIMKKYPNPVVTDEGEDIPPPIEFNTEPIMPPDFEQIPIQ